MSSTRKSESGKFRQERYASSPEFEAGSRVRASAISDGFCQWQAFLNKPSHSGSRETRSDAATLLSEE